MIRLLGRRIALAAGILGGLIALELAAPDVFPAVVGCLLVAVFFVQWAAAVFFNQRAAEDPSIVSLQARAQDAFALAISGSVGAFLGMLVVLRAVGAVGPVSREVFLVGLAFALLMTAAPSVNWLLIWRPWRSA